MLFEDFGILRKISWLQLDEKNAILLEWVWYVGSWTRHRPENCKKKGELWLVISSQNCQVKTQKNISKMPLLAIVALLPFFFPVQPGLLGWRQLCFSGPPGGSAAFFWLDPPPGFKREGYVPLKKKTRDSAPRAGTHSATTVFRCTPRSRF